MQTYFFVCKRKFKTSATSALSYPKFLASSVLNYLDHVAGSHAKAIFTTVEGPVISYPTTQLA